MSDEPQPFPQSTSRGGAGWMIALAGVCLLAAIGLVMLVVWVGGRMLPPETSEVWNEAWGGTPDAERFCVVEFPREGAAEGVNRAILLALDELDDEQVGVFVSQREEKFAAADFTAIPPKEGHAALIDALNRDVTTWADDDGWHSVRYDWQPEVRPGAGLATVVAISKMGYGFESQYWVDAEGRVTPRAMIHHRRKMLPAK